jgi:RsiW-degrading membrane proteinase PrsW (M82 family)
MVERKDEEPFTVVLLSFLVTGFLVLSIFLSSYESTLFLVWNTELSLDVDQYHYHHTVRVRSTGYEFLVILLLSRDLMINPVPGHCRDLIRYETPKPE